MTELVRAMASASVMMATMELSAMRVPEASMSPTEMRRSCCAPSVTRGAMDPALG